MKIKQYLSLALAGLFASGIFSMAWATSPKMKMTTETHSGIATPDKLETRIGTLKWFDGVPKQTDQRMFILVPSHLKAWKKTGCLQIRKRDSLLSSVSTIPLKAL